MVPETILCLPQAQATTVEQHETIVHKPCVPLSLHDARGVFRQETKFDFSFNRFYKRIFGYFRVTRMRLLS